MEKDLEMYLDILNNERCLKKPKEAVIILDKITKCFNMEKSQFSIGLLIGLLLREDRGLFSFVWKTSSEFDTVSAVTAAFKLIDHLIANFQNSISPYFSIILKKCILLLNAKYAKIKEVALKLINNIMIADSKHTLDLSSVVLALEKQLKESTKVSGTVNDQIFHLLGYLFENYPESVKNENYFFNKMYETLKHENSKGKNSSVNIVKGAFEGINGFLGNYSAPSVEAVKNIYEYIKNWSNYREEKKAASRAGLKLLLNRWSHFSEFLYRDKDFWRLNVEIWIKNKKEDREIAYKFLCAFYSVVALFIKRESNSVEVVNYLKEFTDAIESDTNIYEKKAAIVGIKLFVLTDSLNKFDFFKAYECVVNFIKKQETRKHLPCLPICVECVSAFVLKFPKETLYTEQLRFLQRLSVKLIDNFSEFDSEYQSEVLVALEKSFYMLGLGDLQIMESHIERVVYQGLMRTCSSMTVAESELLRETGQNVSCANYKSHLSLWKYLLTLAGSSNLPVGGSMTVKKGVALKVFDVFISSFLRVIAKLNFKVNVDSEVENPSDLYVFINIVDLYLDVFSFIDPFHLGKWYIDIFRNLIHLSRANPLVSGFYKILEMTLKMADKIQFFDGSSGEKQKSFELVQKFLEDILIKVDQFKGELQIACLRLFLVAPVCVIESFMLKVIPALKVITKLARSSSSLLENLIDALERWDLYLPPATSSAVMKTILPCFDIFFQNPFFRGNNAVDLSSAGKKIKNHIQFRDSEFLSLQKKLLMFLGNLEISKGISLIELPDVDLHKSITDKQLLYFMPYGHELVEVNMEDIIFRTIELAESCSDRRTRLTACELLYSSVLIILGNVNQLTKGYSYIFSKAFKTCLFLGCDSDGLVCQIFEPLMYQIMHYFSGKRALDFTETEDILCILIEHVSFPYLPTVREFSADLLRVFTVWSIKQLSPEELKKTPESIKRILQKMYSLCLHPSYNNRLGAAILFNKIYSVLREEAFILDSYWFELFYYFMESLRMCDSSEDVTEILKAIRNIKRPLVEKSENFNKEFSERVVPPEFEGGRLCHLVKWTMERACDTNVNVRHTAMALFQSVAPLVQSCDSDMCFFSEQLQNFLQTEEDSVDSCLNEKERIKWLKYQFSGFEYSSWLLEQKILKSDEVFQPKLLNILKRFVKKILNFKENTGVVSELMQQSVLSYFNLLYVLRERCFMFPTEHWDLLKTAVFKPSRLGFNLFHTSSEKRLHAVLSDLLKYFSFQLSSYEWEKFYNNLETLIAIPIFCNISETMHVSMENVEFLFALKVIESSGLWKVFVEKVFFSMSEDLFISPIFKSLFIMRGDSSKTVVFDPSCKSYLEDVLKIIMKGNVDINGVMLYLENEEQVQDEETEKMITKGEYFLYFFKNTIFEYLENKYDLLIDWVLKQKKTKGIEILVKLLDSSSTGSNLALDVFRRWHDFEKLNIGFQKNKVLLHLTVCAARTVGSPGCLKNSPAASKIYALLECPNLEEMNFSEVEAIFGLLPFVSAFSEGLNDNVKLNESLSKIKIHVEILKKPSEMHSHVQLVLSEILRSLNITASLVIFNFVLNRAVWFVSACKKEDVELALGIFGDIRIPVSHCVSALNLVYDHCFKKTKTDILPAVVYKWFLEPLMAVAPNPAVSQFFVDRMEHLCDLITSYWGTDKNSMDILLNISKKISAAGLCQKFVSKLTKEELDDTPKEKRQLIFSMVKQVFFLLKKPYPPENFKEIYRKLMCKIFNMICCVVSTRCVDQKFYKLFIFDERGGFLFEAIDKTAKYNLQMDFDEIPKRKKHLTVLRKSIAKEMRPNFDKESVRYIQTNTLFMSSLQEDVTRFDLAFSFIRPLGPSPEQLTKNVEIDLEMDSLNSHECMPTLIATISKMIRDKITPLDDVTQIPCWLKFFVSIMNNNNICENFKLFVLKAIYNVQKFVAPFCREIFSDLVNCMLKIFKNYSINYFLIDLIEMMVEWQCVPQDEQSQIKLTELVILILEKSDSLRRDIVKNNVEVLKTMIEVWKNGLFLSKLSDLAFEGLSESIEQDLKTKTNADSVTYLNIHFCGILLSNGIPAWKTSSSKPFLDLILKGFRNENKHNELFGEICGQALNHIRQTQTDDLKKSEQLVREKINSLTNCWLPVLYGVQKHYPKMSSFFTFKIFSSAWDSTDSLTVKKLEMLLNHVSGSEAPEDTTFDRHASVFILDMLNCPDVTIHEISLRIAEKLLDKMDNEKLVIFIVEVARLQKSVYSGVRKWVYEISKKLYRKGSSEFVKKHCKLILLRGLCDGSVELEESCLEFWKNILDFSSPSETLLQILRDLYEIEVEDIFLSSVVKIILYFSNDNFKSKKFIFPNPIVHSCKFKKKNLIMGMRHSFLLSLTSSGRTSNNESIEQVATLRQQNIPYQRPSISTLTFQPTVQEAWPEIESPENLSQSEDDLLPTNPFKRRYYKSEIKTSFSFANWQKQKKKKEQEEEEEIKKNIETGVELYGDYKDGDYPNIQITHSQIIKLLKVLSHRDHQIAKCFLISFYSGLIKTVKPISRHLFVQSTKECFESMLKSSTSFDPGVFDFVLQVVHNHSEDFDIDCQLISNAAIPSNRVPLGVIILEKIIAEKEGYVEISSKRKDNWESFEEKRWLELCKLYRNLEEFDVLSGIFLDKLNVSESARDAICLETTSDWQEASKRYEKVLSDESNSTKREFYTESYLSCLAKLSSWRSLNKCIKSTINNDLDSLWNNYNLLSWFLKSEVMISLGADGSEFKETVEEFCKNNVKENVLSTNFGQEMTVFDWFCGNLQKANYRIDKLCLDFMAEWSHLNPWSYNLRAAKFVTLQTLSELSFAVMNLSEISKSELEQNMEVGLKRWEKNGPVVTDDLTVWDIKLGYRREFFKHLNEFDFKILEVQSDLALAKAALGQCNLNLAKECLSRAKEKLPESNFHLKAEHSICFNMGKMVLGKLRMKDPKVGLEVYLSVWNGITKQLSTLMETESDCFDSLTYSCNFILGQLVTEILPLVKNRELDSFPEILKFLCRKVEASENDLSSALRRKGLDYFETAKRALKGNDCPFAVKSATYLEMSKFFLKFPDPENFENLCESLLKAMSYGNMEAVQLFGCIFNFANSIPTKFVFKTIITESDHVPSWMFLMWINQMLACFSSKIFPFLKSILLRVTKDYPNAIRFPLKMTQEFKFVDPKAKTFFSKQYLLLSKDKLYDDFCLSMIFLAPPNLVLNYYLGKTLEEASLTEPNVSEMKKNLLKVQEILFSSDLEKFRGPVYKFCEKFEEPINDLLTELDNIEVFKRKIKKILLSVKDEKMISKRVLSLLESYSPWLYKFHALNVDTELEIPGQYDGYSQPIEKYLVKVSSFKKSVVVFDSKCRPMKLSILGNDAKEHKFLVKFGEDLRQDERIQQVFRHFNHRLKENTHTKRFWVDTYNVIPLTTNLGMIEWVDHTVSLHEMIENSLGDDSDSITTAQAEHLSFLSQGSPLAIPGSVSGSIAAHLDAYERISRDKAVSNYRTRVQSFPKDLLKQSLVNLSVSPEHFMYLRRNFATSHAVMCVTHWLIGIGDRHLNNTLVSTKSGRVLGIDFGYAFGFATQFLTPPELIPFRLTPQILNVMHPLNESGWIKQTMIHCLRVFRSESFRLRSVLEVFAQEPVVDWLMQAKRKPIYKTDNSDTWYPTEKLALVEQKLSGANPVVVFEADLRAGHPKSKCLAKFLSVLKGVERFNYRARCKSEKLSEEEQVECLIDLATDFHVLSKTYIGWNAWL